MANRLTSYLAGASVLLGTLGYADRGLGQTQHDQTDWEDTERLHLTLGPQLGYGTPVESDDPNDFAFAFGVRFAALLPVGDYGRISLGLPFVQTTGLHGDRDTLLQFEIGYESPSLGELVRVRLGLNYGRAYLASSERVSPEYRPWQTTWGPAIALVFEPGRLRTWIGAQLVVISSPLEDRGGTGYAAINLGIDYGLL